MTSYADDLARHERERNEYVGNLSDRVVDLIDAAVMGDDAETAIDTYAAIAYRLIDVLAMEMRDENNDIDLVKRAEDAIGGIRVAAARATGWRSWDDRD